MVNFQTVYTIEQIERLAQYYLEVRSKWGMRCMSSPTTSGLASLEIPEIMVSAK